MNQKVSASYEKDIAECFDERYQNDFLVLEAFQSTYSSKVHQLLKVYQGNLVIEFVKPDLVDYYDKLALLEDTDALIVKLNEMVA